MQAEQLVGGSYFCGPKGATKKIDNDLWLSSGGKKAFELSKRNFVKGAGVVKPGLVEQRVFCGN